MVREFTFTGVPKIVFGPGKIGEAASLIAGFSRIAMVVTGGGSYKATGAWDRFLWSLKSNRVWHCHAALKGEPSPEVIDGIVEEFKKESISVVVAWGGGSVVDAGKAISAMLPQDRSVLDFLEGVGTGEPHDGRKVPFIAVPTTSGTGTEATKNAVLSRVGPDGFKKSLRHDNFVPDVAVLDPELMTTCPAHVTAACGMDALSQLLESYVSTSASPLTDALALSGLERLGKSIVSACTGGAEDVEVRGDMAYAALMSGITLANAGLGIIHGLAGPIGGFFEIPHGVVCGTLAGEAVSITIKKLMKESGPEHPSLAKYAKAGAALCGVDEMEVKCDCEMLVERITEWTEELKIPRLGEYGITEKDLKKIAAASGNKNNPIPLDTNDIIKLLHARL